MSRNISVSVAEIVSRRTPNSSTYTATVTRINNAWYGLCAYNKELAILKASGYYKHWGFPAKGIWSANPGWGPPSWLLDTNTYGDQVSNQGFGNLTGFLSNSYSWEETVSINRGNARQGSKNITVGVVAGPGVHPDFQTTLATTTLYTTRIADVSNVSLALSQSDKNASNRFITAKVDFVNPENYYTANLYLNDIKINSSQSSFEFTIPITKSMENVSQAFKLIITGKDSVDYYTTPSDIKILQGGIGPYIRTSSKVLSTNNTYRKVDNTMKQITDIYYKDDSGLVHKIIK